MIFHRAESVPIRFWVFLFSVIVLGLPSDTQAGPEGENVVRGEASFQRSGDKTTIRASDGSIIEYSDFDVASREVVQFIQPSSSARSLNRVIGGNVTDIYGQLQANGIVYLTNPAGIYFHSGSVVDVGGIHAVAGNISNQDFINGVDRFTNLTGDVTNWGTIDAGLAHLIGRNVSNFGTINAPEGTVTMLSGEDVLVGQMDGHIYAKFSGAARTNDGDSAAVENDGAINADGGQVMLGAGDMVGLAVHTTETSHVKANKITLKSEDEGTTIAQGKLDVSDSSLDGKGGNIRILGDRVGVVNADVDASGMLGGGEILIGGDYKGQGEVPTASMTYIDSDTVISADALGEGNGGKVIVWADGGTRSYAPISARGGPEGGDGGFVEVSGADGLDTSISLVDVSASLGENGTALFDPKKIVIKGGMDDGDDFDDDSLDLENSSGDAYIAKDVTPDTFTVYQTELENVTGGNIRLDAKESITTSGTFYRDSISLNHGVGIQLYTYNTDAAGGIDLTTSNHGSNLELFTPESIIIRASQGGDGCKNGSIKTGPLTSYGNVRLSTHNGTIFIDGDLKADGVVKITTTDPIKLGGALYRSRYNSLRFQRGPVQLVGGHDKVIVETWEAGEGVVFENRIEDPGHKSTLQIEPGDGGVVTIWGDVGANEPVGAFRIENGRTVARADIHDVHTSAGLTIDASTIDLKGNSYSSQSGDLYFDGLVNLRGVRETILFQTGNNLGEHITFTGAIDDPVNPDTLKIDAGGNVSVGGTIGVNWRPEAVQISDAATVNLQDVYSGGDIDVFGTTINLNGSTYDSEFYDVIFDGNVNLNSGGTINVACGSLADNGITFGGTINDPGNNDTLNLVAGDEAVNLQNTVGGNSELGGLSITSTQRVDLGSVYSRGSIDVSTGQLYLRGSVYNSTDSFLRFTGQTHLYIPGVLATVTSGGGTGDNIIFAGPISDAGSNDTLKLVAGAGDVDLQDTAGWGEQLGGFTVISASTANLRNVYTNGAINVAANQVNLQGNRYDSQSGYMDFGDQIDLAGGSPIIFQSGGGIHDDIALGALDGNGRETILDAGVDGEIKVTGGVTNVSNLHILNSNGAVFEGLVGASNPGMIEIDNTSAGKTIKFQQNVKATDLITTDNAYNLRFTGASNTIGGNTEFLNTGMVTLGDESGDVTEFTGGVDTTTGPSVTRIGGEVQTDGSPMDLGDVVLTAVSELDTTNDGGAVAGASVSMWAVTGSGNVLGLNSGSAGTITVDGPVDNVSVLEIVNSNGATFQDTVGADTAGSITIADTEAGRTVAFTNNVDATSLVTTTEGYNMLFTGSANTIGGNTQFLNTGMVTLGDESGDVTEFTGGFATSNGPTLTQTAGMIQAINNPLSLGDVFLNASTEFMTGSGNLVFSDTVEGAHNLLLDAGGQTVFQGAVGDSALGFTPLGSGSGPAITIGSTGRTVFEGVIETANGIVQSDGAGEVTFTRNVKFGAGDTFTTFGGNVVLEDMVLVADGDLTFGSNNSNEDTLITRTGPVVVDTASSGGAIRLNSATELGADLTMSAGSGNVTLDGDADGNRALTLNSTGVTEINGRIGGTIPINQLMTNAGGVSRLGSDIDAQGDSQIFNDPVVLTNDVNLTDSGSITFENTVDSSSGYSHNLTLNADVTFLHEAVGRNQPLGKLGVASNVINVEGGVVQTTNNQNYQGTLSLSDSATSAGLVQLSSQAGDIEFNTVQNTPLDTAMIYTSTRGTDVEISAGGDVLMHENDKMTVLGDLTVVAGGTAAIGDLNTLGEMNVDAQTIQLLSRVVGPAWKAGTSLMIDKGVDYVGWDGIHFTGSVKAEGGDTPLFASSGSEKITGVPTQFMHMTLEEQPVSPLWGRCWLTWLPPETHRRTWPLACRGLSPIPHCHPCFHTIPMMAPT